MNNEIVMYAYIFFVILTVLFVVVYFIFFYESKPKFTQLKLPEKIYFQRTTKKEEESLKSLFMNIITLAGYERLQEARYDYETAYLDYAKVLNHYIDSASDLNNTLNQLGELTYSIMKELEKSKKLIGNHRFEQNKPNSHTMILTERMENISVLNAKTATAYNSGFALMQGAAIGGLAAVGSWTFVSLVGFASTGTAIASLSGAAAYNATLAWFGGGALAAGGGGMAAGATVLGLIVVIPAIAFASFKSHSKAKEIDKKTKEVEQATDTLNQRCEMINDIQKTLRPQLDILKNYHKKILAANEILDDIIYPNGLQSKVSRTVKGFFNQDFYTAQEVKQIERLTRLVDEIYQIFANNQTQITNGGIQNLISHQNHE